MRRRDTVILVILIVMLMAGALGFFLVPVQMPVRHATVAIGRSGQGVVASPLFGGKWQVIVFADTATYPPLPLADRIARLGARVVVVDAGRVLAQLGGDACLDPGRWPAAMQEIAVASDIDRNAELIVSGIDDGGLLPLLQAQSAAGRNTVNLSVNFSAVPPSSLRLCAPFVTRPDGADHVLTSVPALQGEWRTVWSDQPSTATAQLVRGLSQAKVTIAPYDTPADVILLDELGKLIAPAGQAQVPMAVVEVPAAGGSDTVTLFYSGDGGWRDLDRIVAGEMARQGYPVAGVDTLRTFWTYMPPEQAARDLSATLDHYRRAWGAKSFVLAGYSFGADILAPVYNRLPAADRNCIRLLVFLALSKDAVFEIEVSGWLGKGGVGMDLAPELARLPAEKILCVYGQKETAETGCTEITDPRAEKLALPGGHHFDEDYPKLTRLILQRYLKAGVAGSGIAHPVQ